MAGVAVQVFIVPSLALLFVYPHISYVTAVSQHADSHEDLCLTLDCGPGTCESNKCVCPESYFGQQCQSTKGIGNESSPQRGGSHAPLVVFFLFLIILVIVVSAWVFYAYRNPNTASGLQLIRITRCYDLRRSGGSATSYKYEKTGSVSI